MNAKSQRFMRAQSRAVAAIMIVEDEPEMRELLTFTITRACYGVIEAESAEAAIRLLDAQLPDLVVIDWMLPGMSGIEFARYLRRDDLVSHLPLVMLTARNSEGDKLKSFEQGIDDYITKPFSPRELLARIKALLRRAGAPEDNVIETDGMRLDLTNNGLEIKGQAVRLGPTEFRLLTLLVRHQNKPFSRSQLLDRVWGRSVFIDERTVDVHILRLRKTLKPFGMANRLKTLRSVGYQYSPCAEEHPS